MSLLTPAAKNALIALFVTALLFATVLGSVRYLEGIRLSELADIQQRIAIDTLSLETQFDLLAQAPCDEISEKTVLSGELNELSERLSFAEGQLGNDNDEVLALKRQYTLLEIKDYLLMKRLTAECGLKPVFVLYFYSNEGDCENCAKAGYALSYLRETYPTLRVYSFDYHLDLGALHTLIAILGLKKELPAYVIDGKPYYGLDSREALEDVLPLEKLSTSTPEE
jgi:hypothetical protein